MKLITDELYDRLDVEYILRPGCVWGQISDIPIK